MLDEGNFRAYSGLSGRQPPEHTRLRGFIAKAFTPRRVAVLEPQIRELTRAMLDRFAGRGEADLVDGARPTSCPALVIFRLLGIPDEDVPRVKEWAASRVYLNFGDAPVDEQVAHAENLVALLALLPRADRGAPGARRATTCRRTSCASTTTSISLGRDGRARLRPADRRP